MIGRATRERKQLMDNNDHWFFGGKRTLWVTLFTLILLGAAIRFYDLTDLPLDFNPTRQLYSALKARGMYYSTLPESADLPQRETAIEQWHAIQEIEPPVIEWMSALLYRVFGERLWFARALSSLFWVFGAIPLFLLSRKLSGATGAIIAVAFYLFVPFGIIASRSFQPDPLMIALIISSVWAVFEWETRRGWKWAITAGLLIGAALFVKNVALFPIFFAIVLVTLLKDPLSKLKDKQYWIIAVLAILPTALYTLYGLLIAGFLGQQFAFRFFPSLLIDPTFYLRWKEQIDATIGFGVLILSLTGMFLARDKGGRVITGLWIGYVVYSMTFAYHTITHDYYQLMLIPISAISLAPAVETIATKIKARLFNRLNVIAARVFFGGVLIIAMAIQIWNARVDLARNNYRGEAQRWAEIGAMLTEPGPVLTVAEDYGYRLAYWGWKDVEAWLDTGDLTMRALDGRAIDLDQKFSEKAAGKRYLVITQMNKLDKQPEIKATIFNTYPVLTSNEDLTIVDLGNQK